MCLLRTYVASILSLILAFPLTLGSWMRIAGPCSPQAISLLHQSLAALTGGQPVTDGAKRVRENTATARRNLVSVAVGKTPAASRAPIRSGPDGVSHSIVFHNLLSEAAWCQPVRKRSWPFRRVMSSRASLSA